MAHRPDPYDNGFSNFDGPITQNTQKLTPNLAWRRAAAVRVLEAQDLQRRTDTDVQLSSK